MQAEIATQSFWNTKEEFIAYFNHDSWFFDSIERRQVLALLLCIV
jgi:hypothetical protein